MTTLPAATSTSLFASATRQPLRMASTVGRIPAAPTMALTHRCGVKPGRRQQPLLPRLNPDAGSKQAQSRSSLAASSPAMATSSGENSRARRSIKSTIAVARQRTHTKAQAAGNVECLPAD